MTHATRRAVPLWSALLLAGCTSDFEFELPAEHPARPTSSASGALVVPDPFEVRPPAPPPAQDGDGMDMDEMDMEKTDKEKADKDGTDEGEGR